MQRRHFLAAATWPLLGCSQPGEITGGFTGQDPARGHRLRDTTAWPAPTVTHNTEVLIAGGGVAGLAAARALQLRGREDFALLELEDEVGGNSRGTQMGGIACPLGAHYLPLPSDDAPEVQDLLEELGLRQRVAGRWVYAERHLCHSPQERLFFNGEWQDGLLPLNGVSPHTLSQYRQFSALVAQARQAVHWRIPVSKWPPAGESIAFTAITFEAYLNQNGLTDPHLRWYLNYCCRDDYGAGISVVSAWAGLHYFASRHGFAAPGDQTREHEGLLTWPEGNAWLTRRLAAPLKERLHTGRIVLRIAQLKHGVEVDAFSLATQQLERWRARRVIVALPVFIAARVVQNAPDFVRQAAQRTVYAPWLVANLHIKAPLHDRPGAAPSWDNVIYSATPSAGGLGYVDASHQSLMSVPGATVLTYYRALGDVPGGPAAGRRQLLDKPWSAWRDETLAELSVAHPDLVGKTTRMEFTRYGHAMAVPVPRPLAIPSVGSEKNGGVFERLSFAHSDWAGYSVFEEAFTLGHEAGLRAAR